MKIAAAKAGLKKAALSYPGAWEDHPWGESVYKVGKKIFLFLGTDHDGDFGLSVKLPHSFDAALSMFSWASPTGYGLGKSGWVSAKFVRGADVPYGMLLEWVGESYRAIAPVKLVKVLDAAAPAAAPRPPRPARAAPRRAAPARRR